MNANTIIIIEASNPSAETTGLMKRWDGRNREIRNLWLDRGKRNRYLEPNFLRNERKVIDGRLQQK